MIQEPICDEENDDQTPPPPGNGPIKGILLAVIVIAAIGLVAKMLLNPVSAMAAWGHDWDRALADSAKEGKPMLVLFTADWCPPCQTLKSDVLCDSEVAGRLKEKFTLLKVDLTERGGPNDLAAKVYGVTGVPTLIVFNTKGEQVDRLSGAGPKDFMVNWFDQARGKAVR